MIHRYRKLLAPCCVLALWLFGIHGSFAHNRDQALVLAVSAYDDPAVVRDELTQLTNALKEALPDLPVNLAITDEEGVEALLRSNLADAVITSSHHYLRLRDSDSLSGVLATLKRASPVGAVSSQGGTIVVAADNRELTKLEDLRGRRVAIADRRASGGYLFPLIALHRAGVDRTEINWLETDHMRSAVEAVMGGRADAAFLRSSLLETLYARGVIAADALRVLNPQALGDYPFAVSTRLYPEWPMFFVAGSDVPELTRILGVALQNPLTAIEARPGAVAGFGLPADYSSLREALRELRLPPYDTQPSISFQEIWQAYRLPTAVLCLSMLVVLTLAANLLRLNRRQKAVSRALNEALEARDHDARRLASLNRNFEAVLDRTTDFLYFKDRERRFVFVSRSLARLTGYRERSDLEGKESAAVFPRDHGSEYERTELRLIESGEQTQDLQQHYTRPDGKRGAVSIHMWPVTGGSGEVLGLFAIGHDVTDRYEQEQALERAANYDALTGLPNRNLFFDRLHQAMAACERRSLEICLAYLDLDGFKPVNDTLGHAAGDELLVEVAERLLSGVRKTDTVARLGGDEFVLLLTEFGTRRECLHLIERTMQRVATPLMICGEQVEITASVGLAFFAAGQDCDADQLLRLADQAMYKAKQTGRNCFHIVDKSGDSQSRAFFEQVDQALQEDQFELYYQPVVDMRSGELIAVEALLRWHVEDQGLLTPDSFLPRLSGHPLARKLEAWVLRTAITQLKRWRDDGLDLSVHVNVSAPDISESTFGQQLRELLQDFELSDGLCLEILESAALADADAVNRVMEVCEDLGVSFALDDFGTGYSSLAHIKDLRAACVKVDRRFVQSVFQSYDDFSLLAAIIAMARAFNRSVIAEGVETRAQGDMLLQLGCCIAQGYFVARPMPAGELATWREHWRPPASWTAFASDDSDSAYGGESSELLRRAWERQVRVLSTADAGTDHAP